MTGKRRVILIVFGVFLGFMAVCTLIAKGIYTSGLARVTPANPARRNINHYVEAAGMVKQGQEFGVYVEAGLRVATILVRNGDAFAEGQRLFQIDTENLREVIQDKELELAKLGTQQKESSSAAGLEHKREDIALRRAGEDYDRTVRDCDLDISRKRLELEDAQKALEEYKRYLSEFQSAVSDGDSQEGRLEKQKQLELAVRGAEQAVEDAILAKDTALAAAERKIEDARLEGEDTYSSAEAVLALEASSLRTSLAKLKELLGADGWVTAGEAGKVTDQKLAVGERTTDTAGMLYALDSGDRLAEIVLTQEQAEYVALNDQVTLQYKSPTGKQEEFKAVVSYLETRADGVVCAYVKLEDMDVVIGQSVTLKAARQSQVYDTCIPASALYSDGQGGNYIYIVEEQEGILGKEWRVRKEAVTVLDKNEQYAAIESASVSVETKVVESRSKEIKEGDVVRLVE